MTNSSVLLENFCVRITRQNIKHYLGQEFKSCPTPCKEPNRKVADLGEVGHRTEKLLTWWVTFNTTFRNLLDSKIQKLDHLSLCNILIKNGAKEEKQKKKLKTLEIKRRARGQKERRRVEEWEEGDREKLKGEGQIGRKRRWEKSKGQRPYDQSTINIIHTL